jgi:hypothetical protein
MKSSEMNTEPVTKIQSDAEALSETLNLSQDGAPPAKPAIRATDEAYPGDDADEGWYEP